MSCVAGNVGRAIVVGIAVAVVAVAAAVAVLPFHDSGFACGAPVGVALHGKVIGPLGPGGSLVVMTKQQQRQLAPGNAGLVGLSGNRLPQGVGFESVVCRTPARHRLGLAVTAVGVAMIALGIAWRSFDPRRRSPLVSAQ